MTKGYRWSKSRKSPWYVAALPGDGGVDWEYTEDSTKAIHLSPYWKRRFSEDMRRVGDVAQFIESRVSTSGKAA